MTKQSGSEGASAPEDVLFEQVKWIGEAFGGIRMPHLFVLSAGDLDSVRSDSVKPTTHFPGTRELLSEVVHDDPPKLPHIRRDEILDGVHIGSITFVSPRAEALRSWPSAKRFVPRHHHAVIVTIEGTVP
jgi:hypothetical protein